MVANCEPAEEWLDIDEEDEGGEPVSLDDTPADRNVMQPVAGLITTWVLLWE